VVEAGREKSMVAPPPMMVKLSIGSAWAGRARMRSRSGNKARQRAAERKIGLLTTY
jgi:hypothetical protein